MDLSSVKALKIKREELIPIITAYYESIGRKDPPNMETYSLNELRKCIVLYKINLRRG
jgi:hypothetical protein